MKPTVYVETSVVSAYDDTRPEPGSQAHRAATQAWWKDQRPNFDLYCSQAVDSELRRTDFPGRDTALKLLAEMTMLPITPGWKASREFIEGTS